VDERSLAMKCRDMAEIATGYMEGDLPPRRRFAARLHLWLCGNCRRYIAQLRQTVRLLAAGPPPAPPENESEIIALLTRDRPPDG
jgi:hypothetical protein